jgi:hypothetical protein
MVVVGGVMRLVISRTEAEVGKPSNKISLGG